MRQHRDTADAQRARLRSTVVDQHGLHARIRAARLAANKTQHQVADACGVDRATVAQWESSRPDIRTSPSAEQVAAVGAYLGLPSAILMDGELTADDIERLVHDPEAIARYREEAVMQELHAAGKTSEARRFWSAVLNQVMVLKPGLRNSFTVPIERDGVRCVVPFLHDRNVVRFTELAAPVSRAAFLASELPPLLLAERALARRCQLHLFVYVSTQAEGAAETDGRVIESTAMGVRVTLFRTVETAARALLAQ